MAHGKSTVVKAISGVQTVRFKNELERNITIKLGYANAKIYKGDPHDGKGGFYTSRGSSHPDVFDHDGVTYRLRRHISFVDCFGPDVVFATPTGTIRNADIVPGTVLLGPNGQARTVGPVEDGVKDMYRVSYKTATTDSSSESLETETFTASGGHLLCLRVDTPVEQPVRDEAKGGACFVRHFVVTDGSISSTKAYFTTEEEANQYYTEADKSPVVFKMTIETYLAAPPCVREKAYMYLANKMEFAGPKLNLARGAASDTEMAWLVGLWLGNHTKVTDNSCLQGLLLRASNDAAVVQRIEAVTDKMTEHDDEAVDSVFWNLLKTLRITDSNKGVPMSLLAHKPEVRAAVLAGLIDSSAADGAAANVSSDGFTLELPEAENTQFFDTIVRLVRALGFVAHTTRRTTKDNEGMKQSTVLSVRVVGPVSSLPIVTTLKQGSDVTKPVSTTSVPFTVENIGQNPFRKWAVDGDGRVVLDTFLVGNNCPGHDILMATMLNGAAVMDAALLLVAGNETCPQPQTSEHLAAVEIMRLQHILILQNKVDLVKPDAALAQHEQIRKFVAGTVADSAPILPISAVLKYNIDAVCEYLVRKIPLPPRDFTSVPRLIVIRSFDVNRPGQDVSNLQGGVAGGSILQGVLKVGDEIEVRPGIVTKKEEDGSMVCSPIFSRISSLYAESNDLQFAVPGGLIGVGTRIDPTLTRADRLVGQVLGLKGQLPDVFSEIEISYYLLRRLLGVKTSDGGKQAKVQKLSKGEILMVNIGSTATGGKVQAVKGDLAKIALTQPVCTQEKEKIALSRRVDKHWRLIGWGQIRKGSKIEVI